MNIKTKQTIWKWIFIIYLIWTILLFFATILVIRIPAMVIPIVLRILVSIALYNKWQTGRFLKIKEQKWCVSKPE